MSNFDDFMIGEAVGKNQEIQKLHTTITALRSELAAAKAELEQRWIKAEGRESLPGATTRVLMFVRGVGPRIGTCTSMFEKPWYVADRDWLDPDRNLPLDDVAAYINLDSIKWPAPPAAGEK